LSRVLFGLEPCEIAESQTRMMLAGARHEARQTGQRKANDDWQMGKEDQRAASVDSAPTRRAYRACVA